ncbi:MAG: GNAT family N-acetyltransferase [Haliscomenobacter sp.]|uniref:GNAT family N-acetyltransferase n=1 Tax=Haliscomenobacter sp. TaxID=2717303 RepID=UPI0029ADB993|nr:GNAT family N-acetyltransferase [Haliscomenobacter sp.]MDX2067326.1 GNAT family N-acetyltransferase [Haliscomenobacter sp.]
MQNIITQNFDRHAHLIPGQTPGMLVFQSPKLSYVDSGLSCDTFNIIHLLSGEEVASEIRAAVDYFRQKGLAYCIWVNQENLSGEVQTCFQDLGIQVQNSEPGMVLDLNKYEVIHSPLHQNVELVHTPAQLTEFAESIAANWSPPDQNVIRYFQRVAPAILNPAHQIQLLLYREAGQVVSCLEMFPSDEHTLGFYSLATLEAYRGRGIASAMLTFALNRAKTLGYQQVILQASEDGLRIYEKVGFRKFGLYYEYA